MRRFSEAFPLLLASAALALFPTTGGAAAAAPAGRTALTTPVSIPYRRFTLPNGLTTLVYTDHSVPTVYVGIRYRTGSRDEPPGRTGFAHLFEHLMFQRTANRKGDFIRPLEQAGAVGINGSTSEDETNYFETVPTRALDLALWMESDRMGYLDGGIDQSLLDEQRRVVENEKRQNELRPEERARQRFLAGFYPAGHPYAHPTIGSMQDLDAATLPDVKRWFTDHYGASNAVLVLAGDIDPDVAQQKVTRYFGAIRAGTPISKTARWVPALDSTRRDVVYDRFDGTTITRSWPVSASDPRETTLLMLAARTMTGRETAPLDRELVDRRGIATGVSANLGTNALSSVFTISISLKPGISVAQADDALDEALAAFLARGPDPDEVDIVVNASTLAILRSMESAAAMADWLLTGEVDQGDPLFFLKQRDWIAHARPADVRDVAAKWLHRPYYEMVMAPPPTPSNDARPADVDRSRMPIPETIKTAIDFPKVTDMRLSNGLRLVVAERHRLPLVTMDMRFATGSRVDARYAPGAASAAFGLLMAGSDGRDGMALDRTARRLGLDLSTSTGTTESGVSWDAPADRLDASFGFVSDILRHPTYPQARVDAARTDAVRGIAAQDADPLGAASRLFARAAWGNADPRGRIATVEDARALTREAIVRFHDREIGPRDATLYMVGDITPADARRLAERHFGGWRSNDPAPAPAVASPPLHGRIILVNAPGAEQSSIVVGDRIPAFDPATSAAETLSNAILAAGLSGRLDTDLRTGKGWTYGISGALGDEPRGDRLFATSGTVQSDRTADSIAEIRRQISDYTTVRPIAPAELDGARDAAMRSIPLGLTGNRAFLDAIADAEASGLPADRVAGSGDRLSAVTLDQARAAAARLYRVDDLVWMVIGDLASIEKPVRALGIAPVEVWDVHGRRLR